MNVCSKEWVGMLVMIESWKEQKTINQFGMPMIIQSTAGIGSPLIILATNSPFILVEDYVNGNTFTLDCRMINLIAVDDDFINMVNEKFKNIEEE